MAAQQAHIAETIRAMKLALKRHPPSSPHPASYSSDDLSDSSNHHATNRGHKLNRHARYVRAGRLDDTGGVAGYKRKVQHAGYTRSIIAKKPRVVDNDGDLIPSPPSSAYGEDEDAGLDARGLGMVEDDAFGSVRLERLLRPLTRASELPDHPSLSRGFKSKALSHMIEEVSEMVRRERQCLWKAKRLMARLRGEGDWVPCGVFEAEGGLDEVLLLIGQDGGVNGGNGVESVAASVAAVPDIEMGEGIDANDMAIQSAMEKQEDGVMVVEEKTADGTTESAATDGPNGTTQSSDRRNGGENDTNTLEPTTSHESQNQALPSTETAQPQDNQQDINADQADPTEGEEQESEPTSQTNPNAPSHGMTTRARARSPIPSPSPSVSLSDTSEIPPINPWFNIPPTALPDRDLGLPVDEAEDTRKLLLLYVQKQEQIIRSLEKLHSGLQRADRLRQHVYSSAKAEGHTKVVVEAGMEVRRTEMSDGEDWYDPEEWGLSWPDLKLQKDGTYGLEKGKDEAEDLFVGDDAAGEGRRVGGRRRRVQRM